MELKHAIGIRRTIRYYRPYQSVEREKIQKMLEAARLTSFWGNVQALRAIVMFRESSPPKTWDALIAPLGTAQLKHAPVVILWYWVDSAILDRKTGRLTQGDRLHELVEARVTGSDKVQEHAFLESTLIPYFRANAEMMLKSGLTEMDCGQAIALATLVAFEEGLGTCCIGTGELGGPRERKMRKAFNLPDDAHPLILMSVGYPLENPVAGGQRPKLPFEQLFFENEHGKPFRRDPAVVEELVREKMIQPAAPLAYRQAELEFLQKALDLTPAFFAAAQQAEPSSDK